MKQTHKSSWGPRERTELSETWADDRPNAAISVYVGGPYPDSTCSIDVASEEDGIVSTTVLWTTKQQLEEIAKLIDIKLDRRPGTTVSEHGAASLIKGEWSNGIKEPVEEPVAKPEW